jgi:hypothetical protein
MTEIRLLLKPNGIPGASQYVLRYTGWGVEEPTYMVRLSEHVWRGCEECLVSSIHEYGLVGNSLVVMRQNAAVAVTRK